LVSSPLSPHLLDQLSTHTTKNEDNQSLKLCLSEPPSRSSGGNAKEKKLAKRLSLSIKRKTKHSNTSHLLNKLDSEHTLSSDLSKPKRREYVSKESEGLGVCIFS